MALPCDDGAALGPSYVVYREIPIGGESFDPTVPPTFFPPKDSDELFDALRAKYPHRKTHSERMRDAMIEFLHEEQLQAGQYHAPSTSNISFDSTGRSYTSNGTHSHSGSSVLSSPEMLNFATPTSFDSSPMAPMPQHGSVRQPSVCNSSGQPSPPPSLDQMTGVFSLSSGPQPRPRVRRKMTEAEKVEYRKRRIVKACDKCARRKRKCHHNQPDMDSVRPPHHSSNFGHKVAKSCASASSAKSSSTTSPPMSQQQTESFLGHVFVDFPPLDFSLDLPDPHIDDDLSMFHDLYPSIDVDIDVNDFLHPDIFQSDDYPAPIMSRTGVRPGKMPVPRPWADVEPLDLFEAADRAELNWRDLDEMGMIPSSGGVADQNDDGCVTVRRSASFAMGQTASSTSRSTPGSTSGDPSPTWNRYDRVVGYGNPRMWEQPHTEQDDKPVPTHTAHLHDSLCPNTDLDSSGYSSSTSSDQDALYEALPLGWRNRVQGARAVTGYGSAWAKVGNAPGDRELSSTSVTVSGGVAHSAAPSGRPQSAAVPVADIESRQDSETPAKTRVDREVRRPLSLGTGNTGLLDSVDPKTQLFMLRHRVPDMKPSAVVRPASINAQLSVAAREGSNARLAVIPSASIHPSPASLLPETRGCLHEALPSTVSSSEFVPAGLLASVEERPSDHVLYRDHHGRADIPVHAELLRDHVGSTVRYSGDRSALNASPLFLYLTAALAVYLLFASSHTAPAWILLAAITLASDFPVHRHLTRWGNEVQCTKDNSRWLTEVSTSCCAGHSVRGRAWLQRLMHSFQLAPLRHVC